MSTQEIQAERIQSLNDEPVRESAGYVLYWMQAAQRADHNHALEYAAQRANDLGKPLLAVFGLTGDYPDANLRHYAFMLEGLKDAQGLLKERGVKLVVRRGSPEKVALEAAEDAALVVTDRGYLREQKKWRESAAKKAGRSVVQVESEVVVPVELASGKRESAARTLRPKLREHLGDFLVELKPTQVRKPSTNIDLDGEDLSDLEKVLGSMDLDRTVGPVGHLFRGGETEAKKVLKDFLDDRFDSYAENRNQPQTDDVSHMSKYLHFGHVSPVYVALKVKDSGAPGEEVDSYLDELIVRRELSMNFVRYEKDYDRFSSLPGWAKETLEAHKDDDRKYVYPRKQLESAGTHDEYWNAAMREMKSAGYMHNYMRMYWGKKILEWSNTPEYAYKTALYLNNKYFVDGRDPNSFANVAWVFGQHDRPWKEREVFGKVRYMSAGGLERKAKPEEYVEKVERLAEESG